MSKRRYPSLIVMEMLDCITAIEDFVGIMTQETLFASRLHRDAILRNLEVLGEAANQLPSDCYTLSPQYSVACLCGVT